ncbi:hypothetical protein L1987_21423 [Smallanthus sonchifolius]|uniref:Uncharacterized protein n=1 Tax=Smallanthus sonchifolius TaxID=185202 RepID=A0ACB9IUL8_9ASTR|nr:hypothetical protein L1987_21423 [Smallanthus sonchifolius]
MEDEVSEVPPITVNTDDKNPTHVPPAAPLIPACSNSPVLDGDGFITVNRRKKKGPFKIQNKKQKPVQVRVFSQQPKVTHFRNEKVANVSWTRPEMASQATCQDGANRVEKKTDEWNLKWR